MGVAQGIQLGTAQVGCERVWGSSEGQRWVDVLHLPTHLHMLTELCNILGMEGDLMSPCAHSKHVLLGHAAHQILTWTVRGAIAAAGVLGRMHHPRVVGDTTAEALLHQNATTTAALTFSLQHVRQ